MRFCILAFWFLLALCGGRAVNAYAGDFDQYREVRTYRQAPAHECDEGDKGFVQMSCRYIEVGSIDGVQLGREKKENDSRWPKLQKYQYGSATLIKFAGAACGRGQTEAEATDVAVSRASAAAKEMIEDWENVTFTGQMTGIGFHKSDDGYKCKRTPNSSQSDLNATNDDATEDMQNLADRQAAALQAEEQARLSQERDRAEEQARKTRARFIITNNDRYSLGLSFYSHSGGEWPGNGKQYVLSGTKTYNLRCTPGEKICFGAWRDNQTTTWGAGRGGREGCSHCCIVCGGTFQTSLNDGGADEYPQSSSGGQMLNDVIGALGAGAAIYNGLNSGGGYNNAGSDQNVPRRPAQRPSSISGGN